MIRYLKHIRTGQRGNTGIAVIVAAPFLMGLMLMLVSAQQLWDSRREAQAIAGEAARIGAQSDSSNIRVDSFDPGVWAISPDSQARAEDFIAFHEGATGSVTQSAEPLTVDTQVMLEVDYILPLDILPDQVTANASATVIRGVEDGITG